MHRHARLLLPLLILICAACASPAALSSRPVSAERAKAPIVTSKGALPPRAAERVVEQRLEDLHESEHVREMIDAFRESAQHHVHLETYIFADDDVGRAPRDLLIRRRQEGIEVRVLYDAIGSMTTPAAFFEPMRQAGVEVLQFRPVNPARTLPWKLNNRDHRKIVVVDGRVAFTGGINISSTYASSSSLRAGPKSGQEEAWRDTHVEIAGPAAAQFQTLFVKIWERAGGKLSDASAHYFPPLAPSGAELVAAVASSGGDRHETTIYDTYFAAIGHAACASTSSAMRCCTPSRW